MSAAAQMKPEPKGEPKTLVPAKIEEKQESLPAVVPPPTEQKLAKFERDPYDGVAAAPFPKEIGAKLTAPIDPADVEIKPDGILYYPEIKYRRRLNEAFGVGGWGMIPRSRLDFLNGTLSREYALIANGRFVAEARGEQDFIQNNPNMSEATAAEGVKSNAIMRCCKDLGIASELWDPNFIHQWKEKNAVRVWCENVGSGREAGSKKPLWRRKDRPAFDFPWKETESRSERPSQPKPPPEAKPSADAETSEPLDDEGTRSVIGLVEEVSIKNGKDKKGKPWTMYGVRIGDTFYNTFDSDLSKFAQDAQKHKEEVRIFFTPSKKYAGKYDLHQISLAPQKEEKPNPEHATDEGWDDPALNEAEEGGAR